MPENFSARLYSQNELTRVDQKNDLDKIVDILKTYDDNLIQNNKNIKCRYVIIVRKVIYIEIEKAIELIEDQQIKVNLPQFQKDITQNVLTMIKANIAKVNEILYENIDLKPYLIKKISSLTFLAAKVVASNNLDTNLLPENVIDNYIKLFECVTNDKIIDIKPDDFFKAFDLEREVDLLLGIAQVNH